MTTGASVQFINISTQVVHAAVESDGPRPWVPLCGTRHANRTDGEAQPVTCKQCLKKAAQR